MSLSNNKKHISAQENDEDVSFDSLSVEEKDDIRNQTETELKQAVEESESLATSELIGGVF